jgi:hypothetical protein
VLYLHDVYIGLWPCPTKTLVLRKCLIEDIMMTKPMSQSDLYKLAIHAPGGVCVRPYYIGLIQWKMLSELNRSRIRYYVSNHPELHRWPDRQERNPKKSRYPAKKDFSTIANSPKIPWPNRRSNPRNSFPKRRNGSIVNPKYVGRSVEKRRNQEPKRQRFMSLRLIRFCCQVSWSNAPLTWWLV